jgi:hypothetical protein
MKTFTKTAIVATCASAAVLYITAGVTQSLVSDARHTYCIISWHIPLYGSIELPEWTWCPNGTFMSRIGEVSEIDKFMSTHKSLSLDERTLMDLMNRQTITTPKEVGLPIEVLALQASGPSWHSNELGCPLRR